ncbi:MAG: CdaR family protein [Balneolaceae bacterium]|nr:CdaR family protein [Balneolaceae bacterium]
MAESRFDKFKEVLLERGSGFFQLSEDKHADAGKERIIVFIVALILAICLWLMINLSRNYTLNVNLPISLGNIPADQSLAEDLPSFATVSITGEGWKLINIYNNPPRIYVDVVRDEVNLFDQIQQQMNAQPNVMVQKVQPLTLNPELEARVTKKVPVVSNTEVSFAGQYDFVSTPSVQPDSITISGAGSLLQGVESWPTDSVQINNVKEDISESISLKEPGNLIQLSTEEVTYQAEVEQYTEAESRVFIQTHNLPIGRSVSFSPSSVTVKYNVPIDEYNEVRDLQNLFTAYVDYSQIQRDSSGFIEPRIELLAGDQYNIKIRSAQPGKVAYFMILDN